MAKDIVYFDLETQRTANDVGGWQNKHQMGVSVACTFSTKTGQYHIFTEANIQDLIDQLLKADLVIGFNHISFDYGVLAGFYPFDLAEQLRSLDLMVDIEKRIGHRLKLDSLTSCTLGAGKTADGLDAIRWWQQGKIVEIAKYCCYDVKVTKCLHEYGQKYGKVSYFDRNQRIQTLEVNW